MRRYALLLILLLAGCTGGGEEEPYLGEPLEQSTGFLDVAVVYPYAYVTSSWGLSIIDFSDLENPRLVGSLRTRGQAEGIAVAGRYAFVCDGLEGLKVVDISDPRSPRVVGEFRYRGNLKQVEIEGDLAYVANFNYINGLLVLNISNLSNITLVGKFDPPGYEHVRDLFVDEDYVYLADFTGGLQIVEKDTLRLAATYQSRGVAYSVAVQGDIAVLADSDAGVDVIDVSTPEEPRRIANLQTMGYAIRVGALDELVFVTTGTHGLYIFNLSVPERPRLVAKFDTPGNAFGFDISGSYLYLADFDNGLLVLDISSPASPRLVSRYPAPVAGGNGGGAY
ncbi:MAG: hypothetical protein GXO66_03660 [Euryarchaeota archaeon]|nr:hypothetical protein [Euryarchaeota archaeon]